MRISDWSSDVCSSDLKLVSADLALARSAMGRALAWVAVAIVFGASAWLLVMGVLTALLHSLGLSWLASFAICAALSLGVTGFAAWRVSVFFRSEEHTSELQSLMRISYAVFCLKKKQHNQ